MASPPGSREASSWSCEWVCKDFLPSRLGLFLDNLDLLRSRRRFEKVRVGVTGFGVEDGEVSPFSPPTLKDCGVLGVLEEEGSFKVCV